MEKQDFFFIGTGTPVPMNLIIWMTLIYQQLNMSPRDHKHVNDNGSYTHT